MLRIGLGRSSTFEISTMLWKICLWMASFLSNMGLYQMEKEQHRRPWAEKEQHRRQRRTWARKEQHRRQRRTWVEDLGGRPGRRWGQRTWGEVGAGGGGGVRVEAEDRGRGFKCSRVITSFHWFSPDRKKVSSDLRETLSYLESMDSPQNKDGSMDAVRRASKWERFTACVCIFSFSVSIAYAMGHFDVPCSQLPSVLRCDQLLGIGMLCCIALQVAATLLALTIAGHCIYAAAGHLLLVADPRPVFFGICFAVALVFFAAGDMSSFLALLLGREE